ncbi:hypothetical protein BCR32DRAFT_247627 [Anaeromyces robustus]|uniref:Uncharacterized protein n=1 Tax=Anaeromyces robustus TaxID=1754192 RepID=A0A1Y1WWX0_9FUNG|nr:hypothetical protein BCR32DRAFT_247627 [Anaeromyces robustus]|eukprot:ORX77818.1 hypothetical protein BCR32DRAFT_247627 [Anaeromyces robustus]
MAELTTKSKSSLSILTGSNTQTLHKETLSKSKSLSKGLEYDEQDKDGNGNNNKKIPNSRSLASYDDLTDHKRTLYTCYSSRAITMYNVSSSLKDHTGSTPSMFTLNKTVKTQKMSRSCSGENRSINSNFSASSQNILINNTTTSGSLPKVKTFKDKIFVFKKNRTVQQWMDEFLKKNISDEKPEIIMKDIIDSNTNLSKILDLEEYNSNYGIYS